MYPCGVNENGVGTGSNRRPRFCITCTLNMTSLHYNEPRLNYILQLFKTSPESSSTFEIAYNVTGITTTVDNEHSKANSNEHDGSDYFFDPEEEEIMDDNYYNRDNRNVVQRVVFVIDDSVEVGLYGGRVYRSDEDTISVAVKGMIQVAAVDGIIENDNSNNYIIDGIEDKTGMCIDIEDIFFL